MTRLALIPVWCFLGGNQAQTIVGELPCSKSSAAECSLIGRLSHKQCYHNYRWSHYSANISTFSEKSKIIETWQKPSNDTPRKFLCVVSYCLRSTKVIIFGTETSLCIYQVWKKTNFSQFLLIFIEIEDFCNIFRHHNFQSTMQIKNTGCRDHMDSSDFSAESLVILA